jgi:hypothetical protein
MFEFMDNIRQFQIDKDDISNDPQRAVTMDSPQQGMVTPLHFDLDELAYVLDAPGEMGSS